MTVLTRPRMTVDEYLAWAEGRPGRYELHDGVVHAMSSESTRHAEVKFAVQTALAAGIPARGLPCHVLPDGVTVQVDERTAFEPDAQVYCGAKLPPATLIVPNPVIVVEELSPSTRRIATSLKLAGYFRLPSVMHYLIVDPAQPLIVHHRRTAAGAVVADTVREGTIVLDPPGMELALADVYAAA